jgi:uncharacterized GH25 family protein
VLLIIALAGLSSTAAAHDFWLRPETFRLQSGQIINVVPMLGHGHDRQRWEADPRRIIELYSFSLAGKTDYYPSALPVRPGESIRLTFRKTGVHVLGLATDHARNELPPDRFATYLREEGLDLILADRRLRGEEEQPGREIYSRCAKVILEVVGTRSLNTPIMHPLGLKLEIVPEGDPRQASGATPLRIYYEGKPLVGALVTIWRLDADAGPQSSLRTDIEGRVLMEAQGPGLWQVNVVWSKRLARHPWADFETTFSSLTFMAG